MQTIINPNVETVRTNCDATASQMQCPVHQKAARVELEGDRRGGYDVEVFTCCAEFAHRVEDELHTNCLPVA